MFRDQERIVRIQSMLAERKWDALVCTLPSNVLLLSGYWPVTGSALAIATREGAVVVLAPEDEQQLAALGWADMIRAFEGGSLHNLKTITENVLDSLSEVKAFLGFHPGSVIGYEEGASCDPSSYASTFTYGAGIKRVLGTAFPSVALVDATQSIERLRSVLTSDEIGRLRLACSVARAAFLGIRHRVVAGSQESEVAGLLRGRLASAHGSERCDGFAWCMSGANSAEAYKAYQQSSDRPIKAGEFALVHCNSYNAGFWTDITRTFCTGEPDAAQSIIIDAVLEASRVAIHAVRPGIRSSVVDRAAREVLDSRGFRKEFKHATGHGVGFAAINHNALPRIHPLSNDVLEVRMVFNLEPAVYIPGQGGMRHCNMVAVTENGAELLTPFLDCREELIVV